jgi:hypothetical protein
LCKIRGQLIGADGAGVEGLVELRDRITAYRSPGSVSSGGGYGSKATGKDGRFEFGKVPEGVQILRYTVTNADGKTVINGGVVLYTQGGKNIDDLVIDLRENTCGVGGRVLDRDGKPVKKAYVRLSKKVTLGYAGKYTFSPEFYRSDLSKRKGDYAIERIAPGVYDIEAVVEGRSRRTSEKMTIAISDGQTIELDVRLKR